MLASIHAWWTVLLLVVFIGIVIWAFSARRKKDFDEAARLPLDDDEELEPPRSRKNGESDG